MRLFFLDFRYLSDAVKLLSENNYLRLVLGNFFIYLI